MRKKLLKLDIQDGQLVLRCVSEEKMSWTDKVALPMLCNSEAYYMIDNRIHYIRWCLPVSSETVLACLAVGGSLYVGGIPAALTVLAAYGCYQFREPACSWVRKQWRVYTVCANLKKEFFVRLPR